MKVGIVANYTKEALYINRAYLDFADSGFENEVGIITDPVQTKDYDYIVLPGGKDINPVLFGTSNYASHGVSSQLDNFQMDCIQMAINREKPILGICRGMQLLYYFFQELLYDQGIEYLQHIEGHSQTNLDIERNELFHQVHDKNHNRTIFVNSFHHQAVVASKDSHYITHTTGVGITLKGYRVVEGFQIPERRIIAVQWHPEELTTMSSFLANWA